MDGPAKERASGRKIEEVGQSPAAAFLAAVQASGGRSGGGETGSGPGGGGGAREGFRPCRPWGSDVGEILGSITGTLCVRDGPNKSVSFKTSA